MLTATMMVRSHTEKVATRYLNGTNVYVSANGAVSNKKSVQFQSIFSTVIFVMIKFSVLFAFKSG